ncbi:hypothetical protein K2Z84_22885 [Candidatus Binatia bacterium]|nr:hypothetical protein [Candidatus Binatia bacterium]
MSAVTWAFVVCVATVLCCREAFAQQAPPAAERLRVPMISTQGPPKRIEGKIMRSSRGKKGPVRLLVERKDGEPVTVLVAPEEVCDQLGLSLKADEQVVVDGTMLKSDRPILIATAFVVGDKTIRVRDAEGKVIDARAAGGGPAPAPAATAAAAVTGAAQAESSPKP